MRARIEQRRVKMKLPPILEIDEDGLPVSDMQFHEGRSWSSDDEDPNVQMADFPAEFDD